MNVLYIHGLDSKPNQEKLNSLRNQGLKPFALHINYRTNRNAYDILKSAISKHNIALIVGSSMGGFLGFWLAEEMQLPCFLFNPAMVFDYSKDLDIPKVEVTNNSFRFVVIGEEDNIVCPIENRKFWNRLANPKQRVVSLQGLPHVIENNLFNELIQWMLISLREFRK